MLSNGCTRGVLWVCLWLLCGSASTSAMAQAAQATGKPKPAPVTKLPKPAAASAAPAAPAMKSGFTLALVPAPAWVVPAEPPAGAPTESAPMHYRVIDDQVRVDAGTTAEYSRVIRVVNQAAGLPVASQIELEFDPSYQTMAVHRLDIVRNGQRMNRFDPQRVQLLQREKQLEQRIYDGRVTVSVLLDDVRVGDEIDLAYTTSGQNPVFGGKFVHLAWMSAQRGPVLLYQTRLLAAAARNIQVKKGPADATMESQLSAGWRETIFRRQNVPTLRPEPGAPWAVTLADQLQFSEFADWAEVAAWGEGLFRNAAPGPQVQAKADALRAAQPTPAARVQDALRFVQQEVRYFGIEIGAGTHQPNPPDKVFEQRFGDCKDKVGLLWALLQRLDVPARPVLVSTRLRGDVAQMLPSPLAFDHVIARVDIDGQSLYLDPTRAHQSGLLPARQSLGLGRGLELAAGTTALATLPTAFDSERLRIDDRLRFETIAGEPTLESRITYRGDMAEMVREAISTQGLQQVSEAASLGYTKVYPRLRRLAPASVEPVPDDDAMTLVQRFAVPDFWRFPEQRALVGDIVLWAPVDALLQPKSEARRQPLGIGMPGLWRHRLRVEFAEDVYTQASSRRIDEGDKHFSLTVLIDSTRRELNYSADLRLGVDQVEAAQWPAYTAAVTKALPKLGVPIGISAVPPDRGEALGAELKALEEGLRRQRLKAVTAVQAQSHFKNRVLTAQIDSGRLPPALKAQALVARGIARDQLAQWEDAQRDFEAALTIAPQSLEALNGAAANAQSRGDLDRAILLASQVLQQQPRDGQALQLRALSHYLAGRVAQARQDWQSLLDDSQAVRRGYPLIWLALATQRDGQPLAPLAEKYPAANWPTDWPRPLLDAVFGRATVAAASDAAKASKTPLEAQTEAFFYLGEKAALEGDTAKAREQWKRAVDLGVVEFVEYSSARQRLAAPR